MLGFDRMCDNGYAKISNGSAQPNTVQKLAAPGIEGKGQSIVDAFMKRVNMLTLEL